MEKSELLKKEFRLVTLNSLNTISFSGTLKDCLKVRKGLLRENDKLIFGLYEKVNYKPVTSKR